MCDNREDKPIQWKQLDGRPFEHPMGSPNDTYILGISAYYHDSAACLVRNGEIVAAAQEERFTRKKHDHRYPTNAVAYCLREAGIRSGEVSYVVFYDKPFQKFERLLETYLDYAPSGIRSFLQAMPLWLREKLWMREQIEKESQFEGVVLFTEHHESHAASAFFPSPFESAAILTIDGVGEWATSSYGHGRGNRVELMAETQFPHSLGLLYSAFTYYTGFKVNSGEYKVMGLAPYGEPRYTRQILDELIDLRQDGSFRLNMKYFNYCQGLTMTNAAFRPDLRRSAAKARERGHATRDGLGALGAGSDRGSHAPDGAARSQGNRRAKPVPRRRRGAQLRGQRTAAARGAFREPVDPARGGRCGRRGGRGAVGVVSVSR